MRHRAKFSQDRPNRYGDIANFRFFKMAAAAILDFGNFKFLTVGTLKRIELRLHAYLSHPTGKLHRNSPERLWSKFLLYNINILHSRTA